ncbi:hypothetical protein [Streptomyces sp. KL116D]|uniref:hypothetical protein n=1 Tax=Streptomyces sp. KL116D TaxID=3045152 RepID=UPI003555D91D
MTNTTTTTAPALDELRERAIALGVEARKAEWAGDRTSPVHDMADHAMMELQRTDSFSLAACDQINIRFATYLFNLTEPGYIATIAFDGDLLHPMNSLGEKLDLTGVAA